MLDIVVTSNRFGITQNACFAAIIRSSSLIDATLLFADCKVFGFGFDLGTLIAVFDGIILDMTKGDDVPFSADSLCTVK